MSLPVWCSTWSSRSPERFFPVGAQDIEMHFPAGLLVLLLYLLNGITFGVMWNASRLEELATRK